jgi:hypothetical protein
MNFRDRLPHPRGGWASAQPFLEMTEEEYRAWLKEQGYSEHAIENDIKELREARRRHDLPAPTEPKKEETAGSGLFYRLAKRRRRGGGNVGKKG